MMNKTNFMTMVAQLKELYEPEPERRRSSLTTEECEVRKADTHWNDFVLPSRYGLIVSEV